MSSVANLENRQVVNAAAHYEAQNLEVTPEEEVAMDALEKRRTARHYETMLKTLEDATAPMLVEQSLEAIAHARDMKDGFTPIWHDAVIRREEVLIGKLFLRALELYRHSVAALEVGA